jgi:hypothetical protein
MREGSVTRWLIAGKRKIFQRAKFDSSVLKAVSLIKM